jgi:hypothetical protein
MLKRRQKTEPTEAIFPKNRWEVFKDVLFSRGLALYQAAMLTALFFLPFLLGNLYFLFALFGANAGSEENASNVLFLRFIQAGANLLLLPLAGVGFAGGLHVVRLMAYQEMSFLKMDFKKGIHNAGKGDALAFFFLALALDLFLLAYAFANNSGGIFSLFAVGVAGVFLVFVFILVALDAMQNDLYTLSFSKRLQNSLGLLLSDLPVHLGYALLLVAPNACFYFFRNFYLAAGGVAFFLLIGLPLSLVILVLWVSWSLDRHINQTNFPTLYDKGIVRQPKKAALSGTPPNKIEENAPEGKKEKE